ncbi:hypothetical protein [Streptomyces sp. NPDC001658]
MESLRDSGPRTATGLWAAVRDAAAGVRHGAAGRVAALAAVEGSPRLGWVLPPPWPRVDAVLREVRPRPARPGTLLLVGTGGWAFAARAVAESADAGHRLRVLDRLDAPRVAELPRPAALVVASESGRTLETVRLAAVLGARTRLTPVRLEGARMSLLPEAPTTALFGAPLSTPFLLAMATVHGDALEDAYAQFTTVTEHLGRWAAATACDVDGEPYPRLRLTEAEQDAQQNREQDAEPSGLDLFALQALRQALGGKSAPKRPGPHWQVGPGAAPDETVVGPPPLPEDLTEPARLMARLYAVCALTACLGVRLGLKFAEHPAVDRYKRLVGTIRPRPAYVDPRGSAEHVTPLLRGLGGDGVLHVVTYESASDATRTMRRTRQALPCRLGVRTEFHRGSAWNHHSYQAVAGDPRARVLAWLPAEDGDPLTALQRDIAAATCASLPGRAVLLQSPAPRRRSPS